MSELNRRDFLKQSAAVAAAATTATFSINVLGANERVNLGFMGIGGRGSYLAPEFARREDVDIRYLCDCDMSFFESRSAAVEKVNGKKPQCVQDYRKILDDKEIDGIVMATPDHWHALGTITACQAGKDVYVEKPTSHNIWESRKMIEAARKYKRVVQVGAQNRSAEYCRKAYEYIRTPEFGEVHFVRVLNSKERSAVPAKPDGPVPEGVNYDMWLGPAPDRPFNPNHFHYGWHWYWNYSGGDIINDGVHQMDIARWLIDKKYPKSVCSAGGMFFYKDDQETPDTQTVNYDYDDMTMAFEQTLWTPYTKKTAIETRDKDQLVPWMWNGTRIEVYGSKQFMLFGRHGDGWEAYNADGKSVAIAHGGYTNENRAHYGNFVDCIRSRQMPEGDIEHLHYSTLLCHYGNIAYRTGRRLHIDSKTEGFINDDEANSYVKRKYREGYVIPDVV
jgi:predicted dehydrogenase